MKNYYLTILLLLGLLVAACGTPQENEPNVEATTGNVASAATEEVDATPEVSVDSPTEEVIEVQEPPTDTTDVEGDVPGAPSERPSLGPNAITTESGLKYEDTVVGDGEMARQNHQVTVNYTGWLEDGTQFDSSEGRSPFSFTLGAGNVIPGWEEGVEGMQVGGTRLLEIPPELAYGAQGAGGVIPPNATLIFEVELMDIMEQREPSAVESYDVTESGIEYAVLEEGSGDVCETGDSISIDFTAWYEDGALFLSSEQQGPATFVLGQSGVPGLDDAIAGMEVGEVRQIRIPPDEAAVAAGAVPEETVIFEVRLLEVVETPELSLAEEFTATESGLEYAVLEPGDGEQAEAGDTITVEYSGWLEDGTLFDSSVVSGRPFTFILGSGQVIPGWDEGVEGMAVGEKRQLRIPADLAYGETGSPPTIPPNSTLIFDVELIEIAEQ